MQYDNTSHSQMQKIELNSFGGSDMINNYGTKSMKVKMKNGCPEVRIIRHKVPNSRATERQTIFLCDVE